jgi:cytidylate kinase
MRAVTISREYGSGGGEIAARLAGKLGWQLVDHEIVQRVAQQLNISLAEAEEVDERGESTVSYILSSLRAVHPTMFAATPDPTMLDRQAIVEALQTVVEAAANREHVVIVGRGSQIVLKGKRDVLHVRIVAPLEKRIAYVMRREGLNQDDARSRIQMKEHDRQRYLQAEYQERADNAVLYDIIVNTAVLDLDAAVELIMRALDLKAKKLPVPSGELGPAAHVEPYPTPPADFHPPEA